MCVPSSGNVHSQLVGLPPDVSRKVTVNGAVPLTEFGASVPLPVNAAFGALPTGPPPPVDVIPLLTGKTDDDATEIEPPRTSRIPGVMRVNVQDKATDAESPMSSAAPLPPVSLNVGSGAVVTPLTVGSWQFVAAASLRIWFWYLAWTATSPPPCHAVGLFAARLAAIRLMLWRLIQPR